MTVPDNDEQRAKDVDRHVKLLDQFDTGENERGPHRQRAQNPPE